MDRTLQYKITSQHNGKRIWDLMEEQGFSRSIRTHLKKRPGSVLLNGELAFFYQELKEGDTVTMHLADESPSEKILPVNLPISIVYEDEDILVLNKPSDMPVHPSMGNYENTLANGVAWYFASQNIPFVFRCINRLDRDTTGLLILAKNMLSGALLSAQMKNREIRRTYLTIVEGNLPASGTIHAPIGRVSDSVILRHVDEEHGETAITHFQKLAHIDSDRFPEGGLSLAKVNLETGRTHQIRVHMTHIGHPLPGDTLYNPSTTLMERQALHSYRLEFQHPVTKEPLCFTAPLPEDMAQFFPSITL